MTTKTTEREAFEKWWQDQMIRIKNGDSPFFATSIFPADLVVVWQASRAATLAEIRAGSIAASLNDMTGDVFPFDYDGHIPLYRLPDDGEQT